MKLPSSRLPGSIFSNTRPNRTGLHSPGVSRHATSGKPSKQARPWERPPCVVNPILTYAEHSTKINR